MVWKFFHIHGQTLYHTNLYLSNLISRNLLSLILVVIGISFYPRLFAAPPSGFFLVLLHITKREFKSQNYTNFYHNCQTFLDFFLVFYNFLLHFLGIFMGVFGLWRFDKPWFWVYNACPICRIERFGRFWIGRFGRQDITKPLLKALHYPLSSTFLHQDHI